MSAILRLFGLKRPAEENWPAKEEKIDTELPTEIWFRIFENCESSLPSFAQTSKLNNQNKLEQILIAGLESEEVSRATALFIGQLFQYTHFPENRVYELITERAIDLRELDQLFLSSVARSRNEGLIAHPLPLSKVDQVIFDFLP